MKKRTALTLLLALYTQISQTTLDQEPLQLDPYAQEKTQEHLLAHYPTWFNGNKKIITTYLTEEKETQTKIRVAQKRGNYLKIHEHQQRLAVFHDKKYHQLSPALRKQYKTIEELKRAFTINNKEIKGLYVKEHAAHWYSYYLNSKPDNK